MKYSDLSMFTYRELEFFKYADLELDALELLNKYDEINLPEEIIHKLQKLANMVSDPDASAETYHFETGHIVSSVVRKFLINALKQLFREYNDELFELIQWILNQLDAFLQNIVL